MSQNEYFSKNVLITCQDNREIAATLYQGEINSQGQLIVINSALGVKQNYYCELAKFLTSNGYSVLTWDPRGIGLSSKTIAKDDDGRLRDWGQLDLTAVLNFVVDNKLAKWPDIKIIGHSAGGHLVGLSPEIGKIRNMVFICSGSCYWRLYPKRQWVKLLSLWYLIVPLVIKTLGYAPGKLGIGHDLPKGIALDWRNWSINPEYLFDDPSISEHFYDKYEGKLSALGFTDDVGFSPPKTIEHLVQQFTNANVSIDIYHPTELNQKKIGHFGFFKKHHKHHWQETLLALLDK